MVVYNTLQTICFIHLLGREVVVNGITREQGGSIPSLFDKIACKNNYKINNTLQQTKYAINNKNLTCLIKMNTYPHKQTNHLTNIDIFIRRYIHRMILPLKQLDFKYNPTYTT